MTKKNIHRRTILALSMGAVALARTAGTPAPQPAPGLVTLAMGDCGVLHHFYNGW